MEDIHMHIEESFLYVVTWVHIKSVQALAHFVDQFKLRPTGKVWKAVFPFLYRCQALNLNTVPGRESYAIVFVRWVIWTPPCRSLWRKLTGSTWQPPHLGQITIFMWVMAEEISCMSSNGSIDTYHSIRSLRHTEGNVSEWVSRREFELWHGGTLPITFSFL